MKNFEAEEIVVLNIERSTTVVLSSLTISLLITWFGYYLLTKVNPWGFLVLVPAVILCFQTLWMLLTPYALVFKDKIEIKRSLFSNKIWYFIDIKKISENKNGKLYVVYHDDELEPLNLRGIKPSHASIVRLQIEKSIKTQL